MRACLSPTSLNAVASSSSASASSPSSSSRPVAALASSSPALRRRGTSSKVSASAPAARRTLSGLSSPSSARRNSNVVIAAAATSEGKLISSIEMPAFIPRADIISQLLRWAETAQDEGRAVYGAPLRVTPFTHPESGEPWGFDLDILSLSSAGNDGDPVSASLRIGFDDGVVNKRQWVGRGHDGFPKMEGDETPIRGKCFEIRKVGDGSVDADTKVVIRNFCSMLEQAVNKYYAFGSCFSDDAT